MAAEPAHGDHVLAVDVGGTKTALAAVDRCGGVLARATIGTRPEEGADALTERILARGRALTAELDGTLRAVGAVTPGVDYGGRVLLAPNVRGLQRGPLAGRLRTGFGGVPAGAGNDVRAAALAEARWGELAGSPCGIHLNLGTGLAVSVVVGGRPLEGAHGAAGELGYQLRGPADLAGPPDGPYAPAAEAAQRPGDAGRPAAGAPSGSGQLAGAAGESGLPEGEPRAPLEEYVSGRALAERGSAVLGRAASTEEVFAAARLKPELARLVDEALDTLAVHVANLAVVVDPDRIVACGGMLGGEGGERILHRVRDVLGRAAPFPVEVRRGRFVHDAPLLGAALLAWQAAG